MIRRGLLLTALALRLLGGAECVWTEEPPPHPWYETLHQAVQEGAVDASVIKQLESVGWADAMVTFLSEPVRGPLSEEEFAALRETDRATRERVLREFPEQVDLVRRYDSLPLAMVRLYSLDTLLDLLRHERVLGVSQNRGKVRLSAAHLPRVGKAGPGAWPSAGSGVSVAVIDSGIDYRIPSLGGCLQPNAACPVIFAADFAAADGVPDDSIGHGTNVAEVVHSVAPAAKLLSLDIFDGTAGWDSDILAAIDFALLNRAAFNVRAINIGFGDVWPEYVTECTGGFDRNPYGVAFHRARALDVLPIVAAGNNASMMGVFNDGVSNPACSPGAVRVGAIYDALGDFEIPRTAFSICGEPTAFPFQVTCFSGTGPLITLWAPGVNMPVFGGPNTGTSFSAAHVSGAVAVLSSLKPAATAAEIEAALIAPGGVQVTDGRNLVTRPALNVANAARVLQPVPNDAFAGARVLQGSSGSWTQTTIGATTEALEPSTGGPDLLRATTWFTWQAPLTGTVSFSSAGSDFHARVRVFTGTALNSLTPVTATRIVLADGTEAAAFQITAGWTVRIVVGGQPPPLYDSGQLRLRWETLGGFGDRDTFSQAAAISGASGMLAGANQAATREPYEPDHCANDGGASVWFAWTAPTTGRYRFSMAPGTLSMGCVSVYQGGSVSALSLVAGDPWNDPPPANMRVAVFDAIAGAAFRIVVDGILCEDGPPYCTHPAQGSFTLTWVPVP